MKKILSAAAVMLIACSSCGTVGSVKADPIQVQSDVASESNEQADSDNEEIPVNNNKPAEESEENNTVPPVPELPDESDRPETTENPIVEKPIEYLAEEKYSDAENFSFDGNGAVVMEASPAEQDDQSLINAAQALFDAACITEWNYTVGCPYTLDQSQTAQNEYGWDMYLVTDSGINSISDVETDYYKVFSSRYPNALHETFMESGGRVYALNGERGSNIYYVESKITSLDSRTDDEIFFTVTNYYNGSPFDFAEAYEDTGVFSMVLESDGTWRAGQFTLPY